MPVLALIWCTALAMAAAAIGWMSALIVRRVLHQRRAARRRAGRQRLEAALVRLLQGDVEAERDLAPFRSRPRLLAETLLQFLSLVRGQERRSILAAYEAIDAPTAMRERLTRGSTAGRLVCIEALSAFPGAATEGALAAAADLGPAPVRLAALRSLHEIGDALPLGRLLRELESGRLRPSSMVAELMRSLVQQGPATAIAELQHGRPSEAVELMLIDSLGSAGDYAAALMERATSGAAKTRAAALRALGRLMPPAAERLVRAALADPEFEVRAAAAEAAGRARMVELADALAACLSDPVWRVRFLAATALSKFGAEGQQRLRSAAAGGVQGAAQTASLVLAEHGLAS